MMGQSSLAGKKHSEELNFSAACALLRDGLAEANATVRGYDTKAQIVGVGYIFALGVISQIDGLLPTTREFSAISLLFAWGIVIVPILLFGYVLSPTRKSAPKLVANEDTAVQHILYLDSSKGPSKTVVSVRDAVLSADPLAELSFELLTVSGLRDIKRKRFLRGLYTAALSFLFLFSAQLLRVL